MKRLLMALAAMAAMSGTARADLPPPPPPPSPPEDAKPCNFKSAGDACKLNGVDGVCEVSEYSWTAPTEQRRPHRYLRCKPNEKKKKSAREGATPVALAAGLIVLAAGALGIRRRHRRT